jgi:hypothetical protein
MQHTTLGHNHKITDGEDWKRTEQECLVEDVWPFGRTRPTVWKPRKKEVHVVAIRRGPHLSFPLVSAWERVRPLARREIHVAVGPVHALCDQSARWPGREWSPWKFVRGGRAHIYMHHLLLPWRVTVGIELYAGYMCFRCMFHMLHFECCICFYLDVAYVAMIIHICYKCVFQMFQLFSSECCMFSSGC